MSAKPSVRRARTESGGLAPGWIVTRPPSFGFGPTRVDQHATWAEAHEQLAPDKPRAEGAPSASILERHVAGFMPGWWATRPRWIEA